MRPDPAIRLWDGETHDLGGGLTLIRCGGHYDGGQVLHWRERARAALRRHRPRDPGPPLRRLHVLVSEPDPAAGLEGAARSAHALEPYAFDTIYGAWWGNVVEADGSGVVRRSVDRYVRAVTDPGLAS